MSSRKLVRCEVGRSEAPQTTTSGTSRYVELEIFGLWEYLMASKHGFRVVEPRASLWLDMEDAPEAAYGESQFDRVTQVTAFVYSERDGMFTRVRRYFQSDRVDELRDIFLSHYRNGTRVQPHVREKPGIWLYREHVEVEVGAQEDF
jgi:hypothetical protein